MFGRRPDGRLVRDLPAIRRFMPFISPRRNESLVLFSQEIDVEAALRFSEAESRARPPDAPLTLFHLVLRALTIVLDERPRMNRFVAGGRLWQRDGIWISFSAKLRFDDDAPIVTLKRRFDPREPLAAMADALHGGLRETRGGRRSRSDREIELLLRMPPFVVRGALGIAHLADRLGLLPRALIESDPLYASVFVANLGSVGLEAGYHHVWEHGNISIFGVIGRVRPGPRGHRTVTIKWSFDERIEDGLYAARGLERLRELLAHPEKL